MAMKEHTTLEGNRAKNKTFMDKARQRGRIGASIARKDMGYAMNAMQGIKQGGMNMDSVTKGGSQLLSDLGRGNKMKGAGKLGMYGAGASAILDLVNPWGLGWGD